MTLTWEFCSVLCVALIWMSQGEPGDLPPPTELTYTWSDLLTVNVSWKEPKNLPRGCKISYEVKVMDTAGTVIQKIPTLDKTHFYTNLLTEQYESAEWTSSVRAIGSLSCKSLNSKTVNIIIKTQKPKAKVVEDLKCYIYKSHVTCSWKPVNPSIKLEVFYRMCDFYTENVKKCNHTYTSGERTVCEIEDTEGKFVQRDMCVIATTDAGLSTFKTDYVLTSPKMSISEDGSDLILKIEEIEVAPASCWKYNICYTECNTRKPCQEFSENVIELPYDNRCRYEFIHKVKNDRLCRDFRSDWSDVVTYGANKPDMKMTVVFIIIPVVLSACVILSCYCFRRHSAIIFPTIPDPSAIFKEMMMMNGNKSKTNLLYSPEEEEQSKVTLVTEDSALHQNS